MAACKCRICKKSLNTKDAYCVITNDKKAFYCSQEEFETDKAKKVKEKSDKDKVYRLVCDILGYNEIVNTTLFKEWNTWNKIASNEVIAQYLEENKEYLTGAIDRLDKIQYNRIRYLSAILKNKLSDYKPKVKEEKRNSEPKIDINMDEMMYEIHNVNKNKRKSLADLEDIF